MKFKLELIQLRPTESLTIDRIEEPQAITAL
jgi:hypothetical protein